MLAPALIPFVALVAALHHQPSGGVAQDTTHRDTAAVPKKHSAAYNVEHSVKKAATDAKTAVVKAGGDTKDETTTVATNSKNAVVNAGSDTKDETKTVATNTKNEAHRDADKVSTATKSTKKPASGDSVKP